MENYGAGMSASQQLRIAHYQGRAYYVDVWRGHPWVRTVGMSQWHETYAPLWGIPSPCVDIYTDRWRT